MDDIDLAKIAVDIVDQILRSMRWMLIKTQEWIDHCFSLDSEFRHIDRYRQIDKPDEQ